MKASDLAERFIGAENPSEAGRILSEAAGVSDLELAYAIKEFCYESWTSEPAAARQAAVALEVLSGLRKNEEIKCLRDWIAGISEITEGRMESALQCFSRAYEGFQLLGKKHEAAQTQVAELIPLGLLGDYERASAVGREALATFESLNDALAAGKIEMNLAIIAARQGKYKESKEFCISARDRFAKLNETPWLLMAENDLAIALAELNEFAEAEARYLSSLKIAREESMHLTEAEILASLGNLQTFRGQYGAALRSLELSRKKYTELEMPHRSVVADLEIAEIYQILNLTDEAEKIYERAVEALGEFGMRGEEARARLNYGKLAILSGALARSGTELKRASNLFLKEGNPGGAASAALLQARLARENCEFEKALELLNRASELIGSGEHQRLEIEIGYFRGEILRLLGRAEEAAELLADIISLAQSCEQISLAANGWVSLAKIEIARGDLDAAAHNLEEAVTAVEHLRAPIPAEEFRMAFLSDKLAPFKLSSKVSLLRDNIELAFSFTERARAKTLFERMSRPFELTEALSPASREYGIFREKLNWYYGRLTREADDDHLLLDEIKRLEEKLAEIVRLDSSVLERNGPLDTPVDWSAFPAVLVEEMGQNRVLIEYTLEDGNISAFVVADTGIQYFESISTEDEVSSLLEGLRFQFESMRFDQIEDHREQLKERTDLYLEALHTCLLAPFENLVQGKEMVIVPVGPLFYVPFNALFQNGRYLIESGKISLAPSAAVWRKLSNSASLNTENSLVVAFSDDKSPLIDEEASAVSNSLHGSLVFCGSEATLENYFRHAGTANIIHIACHGQFRADSPFYSNLRLADGFLTVRDVAGQKLVAGLIALSACETGLNKIYPGDEILGLARGFIGAGAANILMTLWTVDDQATAGLMENFYNAIVSGSDPAESLRSAQTHLIRKGRHPYFWAPFVIVGK